MEIYLLLFAAAILIALLAFFTAILTIRFRNKAMRILSAIFTVISLAIYMLLFFLMSDSDEMFGVAIHKLFFIPIGISLFLQCSFAIQSDSTLILKKIFFGLACLIILHFLGLFLGIAAESLYKNSLENFASIIWKTSSFVIFPIVFASISFVFSALFFPNLSSFKEPLKNTFIFLAIIAATDEALNMIVLYFKYDNFLMRDWYTYFIIFGTILFQIAIGSVLGAYVYQIKQDKISV